MATIGPKGGRYRISIDSGTMLQRPFKGKMVGSIWPRNRPRRKTIAEQLSVLRFDLAITFGRFVNSTEQAIVAHEVKGTQWLKRDVHMCLMYGTLFSTTTADGQLIMPEQAVIKVSNSLDVLGNTTGGVLYRQADYWLALPPPEVPSMLVYDPDLKQPKWQPI